MWDCSQFISPPKYPSLFVWLTYFRYFLFSSSFSLHIFFLCFSLFPTCPLSELELSKILISHDTYIYWNCPFITLNLQNLSNFFISNSVSTIVLKNIHNLKVELCFIQLEYFQDFKPGKQHLKSPWDNCSWAWSPKVCHQIRHSLANIFFLNISYGDHGEVTQSRNLLHLNSTRIWSCGTSRDPNIHPPPWGVSPEKFEWVSPSSRISCYWLIILHFIQWGKSLSLKLGFKKRYMGYSV